MIATERLWAHRKDDQPVDQYGHTAEDCEAAANEARRHARELRHAAANVRAGVLVLGRLGGARQVGRLDAAAELFDRVAARDVSFAAGLGAIDDDQVPWLRDYATRDGQEPALVDIGSGQDG